MDELTPAELNALENLSRKQAGGDVPYINIASARRLTELGLALRSQEGWEITPAGGKLLAQLGGGPKILGEPPHR